MWNRCVENLTPESCSLGLGLLAVPPAVHSDEGPEMTSRPTPCSNPQIHTGHEGAGATRCCSPHLHPQIEATEEGAEMSRRRDGDLPEAPASLPDDDDMLREILLRLPLQPSSLPRASAVCRRWRGLVTDPKFHRQFRVHHRKPPLLGVFEHSRNQGIMFKPILDPPDRIPPQRFDIDCSTDDYGLLDCRHGLVLVKNSSQREVVVHDPVTSEQRRLAVPTEFQKHLFNGAVLCAARDQGHVHGGCHLSPFKVVLICSVFKTFGYDQPFACVYTSETGIWGNLSLTEASCEVSGKPMVLVGNSLYLLSMGNDILEFDLGEHSLSVIRRPPVSNHIFLINCQIIQGEHGSLGYAVLSYPRFQMWQRVMNGHDIATWVPWKTIEMHTILKLPPQAEELMTCILGYDNDTDVIFVSVIRNIYMVQLKSMESKRLYGTIDNYGYHPFKSFYTPGSMYLQSNAQAIRECNEADLLHHP